MLVLAIVIIFLAGCESVPAGMDSANWFGLLPEDASYYLVIDNNSSRDLVKDLLKKSPYYSGDTEAIVNSTGRIYISVSARENKKTELSFVFIGSYPKMFIESALKGNKEWETITGNHTYWKHKVHGIELAIPSGYCIVLSQGTVAPMLSAWDAKRTGNISAAVAGEIELSDLVVFFPVGIDEATASDLKLNIKRTLIEEIWITGKKNGENVNLTSVIQVSGDINPEAFKRLFQFMVLAILRREKVEGAVERMKNVNFYVEDRRIKMSQFYLTREELITIVAPLLAEKEEQ